jgi:hypothetical protein
MTNLKEVIAEFEKRLQEQRFRVAQLARLRELIAEAERAAADSEKEQILVEKALRLIVEAGDVVAEDSYRLISGYVNNVLEKMFDKSSRQIRLTPRMSGKNPSLAIEVIADGVVRDLSESSGRGIAQIISLICVICLIVLNGSRRLVALDEVLSGVQPPNWPLLSEVIWAFTEIGFQFIVCEAVFAPIGAKVYEMVSENGTSRVARTYIEDAETALAAALAAANLAV